MTTTRDLASGWRHRYLICAYPSNLPCLHPDEHRMIRSDAQFLVTSKVTNAHLPSNFLNGAAVYAVARTECQTSGWCTGHSRNEVSRSPAVQLP